MLGQLHSAHEEVITSLSFSPHTPTVFCSTSGDDTACLWDVRRCLEEGENKPEKVCVLQFHGGPVNHVLFLPDPNLVLTASDDCTLALWDLRDTSKILGCVTGFTQGVNKLLLLPPLRFGCLPTNSGDVVVASACDDGWVYIHSIVPPTDTTSGPCEVGVLLDKFMVSSYPVNDIAVLNNTLITATEDAAIRSWKLVYSLNATTEERLLMSLDEFECPVNHVAIVPDAEWMGKGYSAANKIISVGPEGTDHDANVEDTTDEGAATGETGDQGDNSRDPVEDNFTEWVLAACAENVFGVDISPISGKFGSSVCNYLAHTDYVRGLEFTSDKTLLTVSDDCTAIEWNLASGDPIRHVKLHDTLIMASALSSDKTILAIGTDSGDIRLWKLPFDTECMTHTLNN